MCKFKLGQKVEFREDSHAYGNIGEITEVSGDCGWYVGAELVSQLLTVKLIGGKDFKNAYYAFYDFELIPLKRDINLDNLLS